jgi:hypothetical protein
MNSQLRTSLEILHQFLTVQSVVVFFFFFMWCGSELRKEIRAEQLHHEGTLRWPLSPHATRSGFDTDEDEEAKEEEEAFPGPEEGAEIPAGLPPAPEDVSDPEASSSEAEDQTASEPKTPRRKKKAVAPRMRYSLFHYDLPRKLKRVVPPSPDEKPPEYSSPKPIHTPAWSKLPLTLKLT